MMKAVISLSNISGTVTAPPSKSFGHRSLICAALCDRPVTVYNCGESDDIIATVEALRALGADMCLNGKTVTVSPLKPSNRDLFINCGESGSTARFMIPVATAKCAENIVFDGRGRLPQRPFDIIADALRKHGVNCSSNSLPMTVNGKLKAGRFEIAGNVSSQYISGLLMALSVTEGDSEIVLTTPLESEDYVMMTVNELKIFGADIFVSENCFSIKGKPFLTACDRTVEGDWSQAAFHLCMGAVCGEVTVNGLNINSLQGDREIVRILKQFGADVSVGDNSVKVKKSKLHGITVDASQIPDLVPVIAVTAAFAEGVTDIKNAQRLRIKESDRLFETAVRLKAFGIDVKETDDGLIITGGTPKGTNITSANDHRIVMAFSVMAANCQAPTVIDGCEAIRKSYPDFFEDFSSLGGECNVICDRQ